MADKLETKYYKLEKLVKWEHRDTVDDMLMQGISPHKVSDWCKQNGFKISHPKLYEYKEMLQKAITQQISVERLLGIGVPKRTPILLQQIGVKSGVKDFVKSEMEVLDGIIQLGFNALTTNPTIRLSDAMKAIELKNKITQGHHNGLTGYGLDQLRELEKAKFEAMVDVVQKYVPQEHLPELEEAIATAERTFYEEQAPDMLEEYERAMQEEQNTEDDIIVSDTKF